MKYIVAIVLIQGQEEFIDSVDADKVSKLVVRALHDHHEPADLVRTHVSKTHTLDEAIKITREGPP